jgi:hypothetical protein
MGYNPLDIKHIKYAHNSGLGDAKVTFDLASLPYPHSKDMKWEKPDPKVSAIYEELVETFLLLPGMQDLFDASADFVLFGLATLPVFKDVTPEVERAFNQIIADVLRSLTENGFTSKKLAEDDFKKIQEFINNLGEVR